VKVPLWLTMAAVVMMFWFGGVSIPAELRGAAV
jgi:hypothetical protein